MRKLLNERNLTGFAVATSLFFLATAAMLVTNGFTEGWLDELGGGAMAVVTTISPLIALVGLYITRHSPRAGGALVAAGAISMGAIYFWFPPFWVLGLVVAVIGATRARRIARQELVTA